MICITMGENEEVNRLSEEGKLFAESLEKTQVWASVDHDALIAGGGDEQSISLPNIENRDVQFPVGQSLPLMEEQECRSSQEKVCGEWRAHKVCEYR